MEPLQAKGVWWVPGDRRKRNASGSVTYSPKDGSRLEAFGRRLDTSGSSFVPVIHGDTEAGPATLLNCVFEQWSFRGSTENITQLFACDAIVIGGHIRNNTLFGWAKLRVRHLGDWARMGSIKTLEETRPHIPKAQSGFYYESEQDLRAALRDGSSIVLQAGTRGHLAADKTSLEVEHQLSLRLARSKSLSAVVDTYVSPLVDLMTLMVDQPSSILSLQVARKQREGDQAPTPFDYYDVGLTTGVDASERGSITSPGTQIVQRAEFGFETGMPRWFDLAESLRGIRGLAFGLRYASQMTSENRFLNATMAAEALHRATIKSTRARVSFRNEATKVWLAQFPEGERQLIRARVNQYVNDPSLADRLSELADKAAVAFRALVPDPTAWVKLVKDIRNDLTHQEGAREAQINSAPMSILAESIAMLVFTCLLIDLGYKPDELKEMILRPLRTQVLQARLRAVLPAP